MSPILFCFSFLCPEYRNMGISEEKGMDEEIMALVVLLHIFKFLFFPKKANSLLIAFGILNALVDIAHCNTSAPKLLHVQLPRLPR